MELKYLFEAQFEDGTIFKQDPKDISKSDPKRSAFYDLLQDKRKIVRFALIEQSANPKEISVNLTHGTFDQKNCKQEDLAAEGDTELPDKLKDFRLIFYRQHQHDIDRETNKEIDHRIRYCLGWQTTYKKKNYQQVLGIS